MSGPERSSPDNEMFFVGDNEGRRSTAASVDLRLNK